jgi:hypothetical protein
MQVSYPCVCVCVCVFLTGTGKSELINSILGRPAARTSAFRDSTKSVKVVRGSVHGIQVGGGWVTAIPFSQA